ncbi:hypothetical protein N7492_001887 [Penicillium capsulatum]|uniref:Uncharacterized protein n=1 Tax=Penicillium capsulatum TaxID=69766 RepID=A0A9W9LZV2_9EURO|nr:hypothetical protein N7492_001887 [Penicillium capsulatum]KAJ6129065.1 hypothetical protein N7512_001845 [Penicillium capsulatum]
MLAARVFKKIKLNGFEQGAPSGSNRALPSVIAPEDRHRVLGSSESSHLLCQDHHLADRDEDARDQRPDQTDPARMNCSSRRRRHPQMSDSVKGPPKGNRWGRFLMPRIVGNLYRRTRRSMDPELPMDAPRSPVPAAKPMTHCAIQAEDVSEERWWDRAQREPYDPGFETDRDEQHDIPPSTIPASRRDQSGHNDDKQTETVNTSPPCVQFEGMQRAPLMIEATTGTSTWPAIMLKSSADSMIQIRDSELAEEPRENCADAMDITPSVICEVEAHAAMTTDSLRGVEPIPEIRRRDHFPFFPDLPRYELYRFRPGLMCKHDMCRRRYTRGSSYVMCGACDQPSHYLLECVCDTPAFCPFDPSEDPRREVSILAAWIQRAIHAGHYTPQQVEKLMDQKMDVLREAARMRARIARLRIHLPEVPGVPRIGILYGERAQEQPIVTTRNHAPCQRKACSRCFRSGIECAWQAIAAVTE